jgi:hypothetical protein
MINAVARADEVIERAARCMSLMGSKTDLSARRLDVCFPPDSVAKLQKWLSAFFTRKEQRSDNR